MPSAAELGSAGFFGATKLYHSLRNKSIANSRAENSAQHYITPNEKFKENDKKVVDVICEPPLTPSYFSDVWCKYYIPRVMPEMGAKMGYSIITVTGN